MRVRPPEHVLNALLGSLTQVPEPNLPALDRIAAPWESSMQATCECLSWRGALDNLARRHREDRLGETTYAAYPVHTRSALVVTHTLLEQGQISDHELSSKMTQVRRRLEKCD